MPRSPALAHQSAILALAAGLCASVTQVALAQGPLSEPFPAVYSLSELNGGRTFRMDGAQRLDRSGRTVASVGDVNGDGIDDVIVGAEAATAHGAPAAGVSYVIFGRKTASGDPFPLIIDFADLDGTIGFRIEGVDDQDRSGNAVSSAGDLNGDGIGDFVVSASSADPGGRVNAGSAYVVFGRNAASGGFPAVVSLAALDGTNGFRLDGESRYDFSGSSVASAGDVNNDGLDDLLIGAGEADPDGLLNAGASYVLFGRDATAGESFPASIPLSDLSGSSGFQMVGTQAYSVSGISVASAGDMNGDGISDMVIGARGYSFGYRDYSGAAFVVFGRDATAGEVFPDRIRLSDLDGSDGFRLDGDRPEDLTGSAVTCAGDLNADGIGDIIIGAYSADVGGRSRAGVAYIVFGRDVGTSGAFPASFPLAEPDGIASFSFEGLGTDDFTGRAVARAGDLNGDGIDDVVIAAPSADPGVPSDAGSSYVIYGRNVASGNTFPATLNPNDLDGEIGFRLDGVNRGDQSGRSVAPAGDVNGDGRDDLIIGAWLADPLARDLAGSSYVVFGRDAGEACRPDLDSDGELTIFDFLTFQNLFNAMNPAADFDGDGEFTLFDFLAFQNAFDAGCP